MTLVDGLVQRGRHLLLLLLLVAVFAGGFAVGTLHTQTLAQQTNANTEPPANAEETFAPFWEVYNLIDKIYIDDVETDAIVNGAIQGMIDALEDQYSGYIEPEFFAFVDANLSGEIEGIGAVVSLNEETQEIGIVNVLEGTPAEAAGLREGDIFITVNGEDVAGFTTLELVSRVRGPAGTTVALEMRRGEEIVTFSVIRARIEIQNVTSRVINENIGYVELTQFTANAREQIDQALAEIDAQNLDGLIIDFRNNPGGLLSSAVDIASILLPTDTMILTEEFGDETSQIFRANGTEVGLTIPVVLLVDERSASASELVAAAWQDAEAATLVGTVTFGKGTVQQQHDLVNGGGVRLTVARWVRPSGEWIHEIGVTPDIAVEWTVEEREANPDADPQLEAAIEYLNSAIDN